MQHILYLFKIKTTFNGTSYFIAYVLAAVSVFHIFFSHKPNHNFSTLTYFQPKPPNQPISIQTNK